VKGIFRDRLNGCRAYDRSIFPRIYIACALSIAAFAAVQAFSGEETMPYTDTMARASRIMHRAVGEVRQYCEETGIEIDTAVDPNRTGLIGSEYTGLATTIGHLDAKRTTTSPEIAGLIVHLLDTAGVEPGDTIAVGSSGSFPALLIASLSAARAMNVHPVVIISLGASSYGATREEFNLLDIYQLLLRKQVFDAAPAAVSLGGEKDVGDDYEADLKERLLSSIRSDGVPFINEPDLRKNVTERMKIYGAHDAGGRIAAFVNAGGSYANLGTSALALKLKPGLNTDVELPPEDERGVVFGMAARSIPCIHLLYIKGLAQMYGLLWDPMPLPEPGEAGFHIRENAANPALVPVVLAYFLALTALIFYRRPKKRA